VPNEEGASKAEAAGVGEGEAAGDSICRQRHGRSSSPLHQAEDHIGSGRKLHFFVDMHRRAICIGDVVITTW
jgi:hypothetical protein